MIFKSKYIFETRHTRYLRYIRNIFASFFIIFLLYSFLSLVIILGANREIKQSDEALFQSHPDLIAIFTGDLGRIPFAIRKAQEFNQYRIFISGVYSKNSVQTLITPLTLDESFDPTLLEIDYTAKNTVENVISLLHYLRKNHALNRVLIISHDYHITRIKMIVSQLKKEEDKVDFYYSGVRSDYLNLGALKKLYKEVFKLMKASIFLMFWEDEIKPDELKLDQH